MRHLLRLLGWWGQNNVFVYGNTIDYIDQLAQNFATFLIESYVHLEYPFRRIGKDAMNAPKVRLDRTDRKILEALQEDARLSSAELAERVALTTSPCWRRVKRLEEEGVITGYQAKVDPARLGYQVTAIVHVSLDLKGAQHLQAFERAVAGIPQVLACYRVSGRYDHQLTVVAEDLAAYGAFAEANINSLPYVKEIYTSFVLREVKSVSNPPLPAM
jgi:Lrp/AsnC family transcriptional regulator, leucine-responsive regulatory protein